MFQLFFTTRFRKDVKLLQKRGYDMELLKVAVISLEAFGELPAENLPHRLSGNYAGFWEAHLKSNWILIWKIDKEANEIWLTRTGTHADLF